MGYAIFLRSDTQIYHVGNFVNLNFKYNTPVSPMPLPEEDSTENLLVKLEGNSQTVSLSWLLINEKYFMVGSAIQKYADGYRIKQDVGYYHEQSRKPFHQYTRLIKLAPTGINDVNFDILILDNDDGVVVNADSWWSLKENDQTTNPFSTLSKSITLSGTWQGLTFNIDGNNPVNISVSLDFIEGTTVQTLNGHAPEASVITNVTSTVAFTLKIYQKEFPNYAKTTDRPNIKYAEFRATIGGEKFFSKKIQFIHTADPNNTEYDITFVNIPDGDYTDIKMRLYDDKGNVGKWSDEWPAEVPVSDT